MNDSPDNFINHTDDANERMRSAKSEPQQSADIITRIEQTLSEMGMSQQELKELIATLLGLGQDGVEVDGFAVNVSGGEDVDELAPLKPVDTVYSPEKLLELLQQLDLLQRLRMIEKHGHQLDASELEMLIEATGKKGIDSKKLQAITFNQQHVASRRNLSKSELGKLDNILNQIEIEIEIEEVIASSGGAGSAQQKQLLDTLSKQHLQKDQQFVMGAGNKLQIQQQKQIQEQTKSTQTRLVRLDYIGDMARLLQSARRAFNSLNKDDKGNKNSDRQSKFRDREASDKVAKGKRPDEDIHHDDDDHDEKKLDYREQADKETGKDQKKLQILDHFNDMKHLLKSAQKEFTKRLKGEDPEAMANKAKWDKDGEARQLAEEQKAAIEGEHGPSDIEMAREFAEEETGKDQHKLKVLDHQADKQHAQSHIQQESNNRIADALKQKSASAVARDMMTQAKHDVDMDTLSPEQQAKAFAKSMGKVEGGKDARLDKVGESLDKIKELEAKKKGREIGD